jgi:hypothetical protein
MALSPSDFQQRILESYRGKTFQLRRWRGTDEWTHDHCPLCNAQIRESAADGDFSKGYVTFTPIADTPAPSVVPGYRIVAQPTGDEGAATWFCPPCFLRHRAEFEWKLG